MAQTNTPLSGYPMYAGKKYNHVFDHLGPANYQQATGDVINATDIGLGGFDESNGMGNNVYSVSGNYYARAAALGSGLAQPTLVLHWYVVATGLEVGNGTNLSGETVRMQTIGV